MCETNKNDRSDRVHIDRGLAGSFPAVTKQNKTKQID